MPLLVHRSPVATERGHSGALVDNILAIAWIQMTVAKIENDRPGLAIIANRATPTGFTRT